jgi:DNA repair protein RecN (Recombination protein N)
MLSELSVRNFALIDRLDLSFGPGFNVLTGETGAGKSILVGAIGLILGGRAFSDTIRQGAEEAEVQALFVPANMERLNGLLREAGLPEGDEVIVRRVLQKSGRNKVYINGALATLAQLTELGRELVAVSGQHEHQQLLDPDRQLELLDQFGGLLDLRERVSEAHREQTRLGAETAALRKKIDATREKADLLDFQAREIEAADLQPNEDEDLEKERTLVRNAEKIYRFVAGSYERLYGETGSVIEILDSVRGDLATAAQLDERLTAVLDQVEESYHQLDDAAGFLRGHQDQLTFDPERLDQIEDRLALIGKLKRKYGPALDDVMSHGRLASGHMDDLALMEKDLAGLETALKKAEEHTVSLAEDLSSRRQKAAKKMADDLAGQLRTLGMPKVGFQIRFLPRVEGARPGPLGYDEIEFMISPNLGEDLRPLARIASGGELSRATLGIKSILAGRDRVQTVIFDEVDAGIGGTVAEVVGRKLKELSGHHQLVCITHLPQIAAFGRTHQHVYKEVRGQRTVTGIRPLADEERLEELARMISGADPTEKSRATAREMVARAEG